jgi:5-bromo-4-chloroindolyl phosphate hydrolysis protein
MRIQKMQNSAMSVAKNLLLFAQNAESRIHLAASFVMNADINLNKILNLPEKNYLLLKKSKKSKNTFQKASSTKSCLSGARLKGRRKKSR